MSETTEIITLEIEARGEIVSSNFPAFAEMVRVRLGEINRDLSTDDDFDQADKDAKAIAGAEASLKAAKEKALADAEQLHALFEGIDGLTGELAKARLDLAGQIKKRKEERTKEVIEEFLALFDIAPAAARRSYLKGLQESAKGKRTVESMKTACRIYQVSQQAIIVANRKSIATFEAAHGQDLTMDRTELELQSSEYLTGELRRRFEAKKAADELKRSNEEAAAAKAEAAKAAQALVEANKPPAPPMNSPIPAKQDAEASPPVTGQSEHEEWVAFKAVFASAFGPAKAAREALNHSKNIAKAQGLAAAIGAAWKEWV